jgi:hypothetical protein
MALPITVKGEDGKALKIIQEGAIGVVKHRHPPIDESIVPLPFRQYFTDSGASSGSNDMTVNGSSTNVEFWIEAIPDYDIFIKSISVIIGDGGSPSLNDYGSLGGALTNGVLWQYVGQDTGAYELHDGIKSNLEFIRLGVDTGAIGTGTDAYLADVSGGGTEKSYIPTIDMQETFGLDYGIRLRKATNDKLRFTVRDDLTGLTTHNIIGYGIRI